MIDFSTACEREREREREARGSSHRVKEVQHE